MKPWTLQDARELYNIKAWGAPYFDINTAAHVAVKPGGAQAALQIDLYRLAQEIQTAGYALPILVRFPDILTHRVQSLCTAFDAAFAAYGYVGGHTAVYPIKVNQQRCVVERIARSQTGRVGLEAGSKTELMAVLAQTLSENGAAGTLVCNGYKDREYIRLALIGQKFGKRVFIVIEQMAELHMVLEEADKLGVHPNLGVRIRLMSLGKGRWQNTGGQKSKFGLTAAQLLCLLQSLKHSGRLQDLKLLHFHMGSQLAELEDIKKGLQEAGAYFAELCEAGASIEVVDVGGGIGVDYQGSGNTAEFSINYSLDEYANAVVAALQSVSRQYHLPEPEIITEAGRAVTAQHAVLITNVVDKEQAACEVDDNCLRDDLPLLQAQNALYVELDKVTDIAKSLQHYAELEAQLAEVFRLQSLNLQQRAALERMSCRLAYKLLHCIGDDSVYAGQIESLQERIADKYFCNFSVFQSLPDVWGLDQVFPIMPLARLDEMPQRHAVLHDLTCDSDGHIEYYAGRSGLHKTLPVHATAPGEAYLLGFFMVGAYQETLGDMHNLFGDTHTINVVVEKGEYHFEEYEPGDRADELLQYVHYNPALLLEKYQQKLANTDLSEELKQQYLQELSAGLSGYTYLED